MRECKDAIIHNPRKEGWVIMALLFSKVNAPIPDFWDEEFGGKSLEVKEPSGNGLITFLRSPGPIGTSATM